MTGPQITYTATLYQEQATSDTPAAIEVTVIEDVRGGISGPATTFTMDMSDDGPTDIADVDNALTDHCFTRITEWRIGQSFQGMQLICDVVPS